MDTSAIILTPISKGCIIPPCEVGYPRIFSECENVSVSREINININRARLQRIYHSRYSREYPFVFLIDSDVIIDKEMLERLRENWKEGCTPCVNTKGKVLNHVVTSCCFLNGQDYLKVDYLKDLQQCQCRKLPNPFYVDGLATTEWKQYA